MKSLSETADYCSRCGADLQIVSLKFSWRGVETKAACPECTTIASATDGFNLAPHSTPSMPDKRLERRAAV